MRTLPLTTALLLLASTAPAQVERTGRPVQVVAQPVQVTAIDVSLAIDGPGLLVTQRVTLTNPAPRPQEYDLIFPLGDGSVISGVQLSLGEQVLEGTVYPADEARRIYQQITRQQRDPALLEHYGEAMFRARVFPVPANGSQTLSLTYRRVLEPEGDATRLHVPLTAWRRSAKGVPLSIRGELVTDFPMATLYSPTHSLDGVRTVEVGSEPTRYLTTFQVTDGATRCELDFLAYFKARSENSLLDVTVLSERPNPAEDGYFLAVINGVPNDDVAPEPKNVVFVLDQSGSMQGKKIEQARDALKFMVERLRPEDRFNIVAYSVGVRVFANGLQEPSQAMQVAAKTFIDGIHAEGGTNIQDALATALAQFDEGERVNQVVFLTDGLPTIGERDHRKLCKMVRERNVQAARIVAFGVGFDVNGAFLDRLAVQNKGLSEYVLPSDNIEEKVPGFYSRMQSPLLLDTKIEIAGGQVHDVYPRETSDIYGGHQLLITGRYSQPGPAKVVVTGRRGGTEQRMEFNARLAVDATESSNELVARMWAAKKVGYLVDEIRLNGEHEELVTEIVRLGTRYGILTEYTSFLAAPETDLALFDDNVRLGRRVVGERAGEETGGRGVSQAANSKLRQRADRAETRNEWFDDDGSLVTIDNVQNVGGKAYFLRADGWLDSELETGPADLEVDLFTDDFFALLDQNAWLPKTVARTGFLTVDVAGQKVRIR